MFEIQKHHNQLLSIQVMDPLMPKRLYPRYIVHCSVNKLVCHFISCISYVSGIGRCERESVRQVPAV